MTTFLQDEVVNSTLTFMDAAGKSSKVAKKSSGILPEMDFNLTDTEVLTKDRGRFW